MKPGTPNPSWWSAPPRPKTTPLTALRTVADHLERGEAVPAPEARLVAAGIRRYLAGAADLPGSLGLKPAAGQRSELTRHRLAQRNGHIRAVFEALPGERSDRARKTAALLASPPPAGEITEADVMAHLLALHQEHGGDLPRSWSQVLRVVGKE